MFLVGCVFIDHVSAYVSINHQVVIKYTKTVKEKLTFEREYKRKLVMIHVYHTYNGIFNTSKFMEVLLKNQQKIRFSGVRASHQNGSAERTAKTLVTMERTMLMKAWMICH